jgi:hypothetical protein
MGLLEIDASDYLMTVEHFTLPIGIQPRARSDRPAAQCTTQAKLVTAIIQAAVALYLSHPQSGWIFNRREAFGNGIGLSR